MKIVDYHRAFVSTRAAIHPGEHLAEGLDAFSMNAAELARQIGVPTNRVSEILNGRRSITGDVVLRFGHFFYVNPQFWLNLQSIFDLRIAEQSAGETIQALPTLRQRPQRSRHGTTERGR